MIDFLKQQNEIKNYIATNLPIVLAEAELNNFDAYIDDYIDLDLYQKQKQLFYSFGSYNYENLSNESNSENLQFSVYLIFQDNLGSISKELMLKYAAAFYEMFSRSGNNFNGIGDYGKIDTVDFYNAAEGNQDIKAAEITISLYTER